MAASTTTTTSMRVAYREPGGPWQVTPSVPAAHAQRMTLAAARLSAAVPSNMHLSYFESPTQNQATLVDTAKYKAATTPEQKSAAYLYQGPVPAPRPTEVAAALHTLRYSGVNPLKGAQVAAAYGRHVAPEIIPPAPDPGFYQRILSNPNARLSPALRALYQKRAQGQG